MKNMLKEKEPVKIKKTMDYRVLYRDAISEVREYPPAKRTIFFEHSINAKVKEKYFVQMPYMIFVQKDYRLFLGMAKAPIQSVNDDVYFPTMANIYAGQRICLSYARNIGARDYNTKKGAIEPMIDYFWQSKSDVRQNWTGRLAVTENFGSYEAWEKMNLEEVCKNLKFRPIALKKLAGREFVLGKT